MDRKPPWLKVKMNYEQVREMEQLLDSLSLNTVCKSAHCPNRGECFKKHTATFMIMGENCTRNCRFCTVSKGKIEPLDENEPENVAIASKKLGLKHIVVTSVTRDDLPDYGADHFAKTITMLKKYLPESTVEVLIPDLMGDISALKIILNKKPDILNHNIETVKSLYDEVRPMAEYDRSLLILKKTKEIDSEIFTKSGIMVGLGETCEQVYKVMDDLLDVGCDILTIGQYLQPTKEHLEVKEFVIPEQFEKYKQMGLQKGFKYVASGPFVRSSYNAKEGMDLIKKETSTK